jgi:hypothetical protein
MKYSLGLFTFPLPMQHDATTDDRERFRRLLRLTREQHVDAVRAMTREELNRYVHYLSDLHRMSVEEYEAMLGRPLDPIERDVFEWRTGKHSGES